MEKFVLDVGSQMLEASGVSGYAVIVWDDEPPLKWVFRHKFRMKFVLDSDEDPSFMTFKSLQTEKNMLETVTNVNDKEENVSSHSENLLPTVDVLIDGKYISSDSNPVQPATVLTERGEVAEDTCQWLQQPIVNETSYEGCMSNENLLQDESKPSLQSTSKEEISRIPLEGDTDPGSLVDDTENEESISSASIQEHFCNFCQKFFPSTKELESHGRDPLFQVKCEHCGLLFPSRGDLFVHQFEVCDIDFIRQQFPQFKGLVKTETGKQTGTVQCPVCGVSSSVSSLTSHVLSQHFSEPSYKCCVCGKAATNDTAYFSHCHTHLKGKHKIFVQRKKESLMGKLKTLENQKIKDQGKRDRISSNKNSSILSLKAKALASGCLIRRSKIANGVREHKEIKLAGTSSSKTINDPQRLSMKLVSSTANSSRHQRPASASEKRYLCPHCDQIFKSPIAFQTHRKTPSLNIKCSLCEDTLASRAQLLLHEQRVHKLHSSPVSSSFPKPASSMQTNTLGRKRERYAHCPVCSVKVSRSKVVNHVMRSHTDEYSFRCCVCHLQFCSQEGLKSHYNKHAPGSEVVKKKKKVPRPRTTQFKCRSCPGVFNSKSEFHRHNAQHRTVCVFCNEDFQLVKLVEEHYEREHLDQLYKCRVCGKKLPTKEKLDCHERNHRFSKAKPCHKCGAMIKCLSKHLQTAHMEPGSELQCSQCPMKFKSRGCLESHQRRIHSTEQSSFSCPKCPKVFEIRDRLSNHLKKVHMNTKIFECEICGKQCTERFNLRIHMRSHSNQTFFTCDVCGQGFKYKASLQGHMQSKHNGLGKSSS